MITQNTDGSQTIQASDLIEYSLELQSLVKQGYAVQVTNDEAPILIGYMCVATLKKECLADSEADPETFAEMQVKIVVDAQQAIDEITKLAQVTGQYDMTPEQECKAIEAVKKAISVEPTAKKPSGRPKANKGA